MKYIEFEKPPGVENYYFINNKRSKEPLGAIEYYKPWKQFIFSSDDTAVWSADCLEDVIKKLKELNGKILKRGHYEVQKKAG